MTPTAKFRWLELPITGRTGANHPSAQLVGRVQDGHSRARVLQQWWGNELPTIVAHGTDYVETERKGEWRDIPVEEQA